MKGLVSVEGLAALALLLSGCIIYQMDKTPPCDGLSDAARVECKFKPKCLLKCEFATEVHKDMFGREMPVYDMKMKADMSVLQKDLLFEFLNESGLFESCRVDASNQDAGIVIDLKCSYAKAALGEQVLSLFTLGIYPARWYAYDFSFAFEVSDAQGRSRQYRMKETLVERQGPTLIFVLPFAGDASHDGALTAMYRKIVNQLLVKMQQDAFFSAEGRDKAAAVKADVVEAAKKTVAARRKELEDLKTAGVITADEYRKEIEGVVK